MCLRRAHAVERHAALRRGAGPGFCVELRGDCSLGGGLVWDYSPKLRVEGRMEWRDAEYRGDPGFGAQLASRRKDQGLFTSVAATWQVAAHTRCGRVSPRERTGFDRGWLEFQLLDIGRESSVAVLRECWIGRKARLGRVLRRPWCVGPCAGVGSAARQRAGGAGIPPRPGDGVKISVFQNPT